MNEANTIASRAICLIVREFLCRGPIGFPREMIAYDSTDRRGAVFGKKYSYMKSR